PTNVMSSMNATESGSMSRPAETLKESVVIQSYRCTLATRSLESMPRRANSSPMESSPDAVEASTPSQCPQEFAALPATSNTPALRSGMAIINQDQEMRS